MPKHRSDGERKSVSCGGVKAASRASGSANALALTRPKDTDIMAHSYHMPQLCRWDLAAHNAIHHEYRNEGHGKNGVPFTPVAVFAV